MKSRIWRLAGVGLLVIGVEVSVAAQSQADEPQNRGPEGGQHGDGGHQGDNNQGRGGNNQPRQQNNDIIRGDNSRQFERDGHQNNAQNQNGGQWQSRPQPDFNNPVRPPPPPPQLPANDLPIQGRPDTVQQTQQPRRGYYQDQPRRNDPNQHWNGYIGAPSNDPRGPGRGNGWGPGPQYRPGHVIDRFPDRDYRVPYRGMDYYYSGGYWYRPLGPRYVVVEPPRGIRVRYLPDYAEQVLIGGSVLFLAAGSYYAWQDSTQDYVVVEPPMNTVQPQPVNNGYDVVAYPASGQTQEQVNQDGYECYQYAVQQSGFDPRTATYQPAPSVVQTYRQAQGNCLSSRGYQVQ
ncbi:DUF6515 family protein [Pseudomonas fluorescens]|jgi:hypothetical protein|uniref:DUF6515 family protein n=1 Tax=Pseudomonas fluorescens TaxID=294 RepID=UPI002ACA2FAE|nr:DUF6515 family protein [Pseudomonas fluorescens]MDZ5432502.1 DUF6515 family protein [Pseudomonas fluorescens]